MIPFLRGILLWQDDSDCETWILRLESKIQCSGAELDRNNASELNDAKNRQWYVDLYQSSMKKSIAKHFFGEQPDSWRRVKQIPDFKLSWIRL